MYGDTERFQSLIIRLNAINFRIFYFVKFYKFLVSRSIYYSTSLYISVRVTYYCSYHRCIVLINSCMYVYNFRFRYRRFAAPLLFVHLSHPHLISAVDTRLHDAVRRKHVFELCSKNINCFLQSRRIPQNRYKSLRNIAY